MTIGAKNVSCNVFDTLFWAFRSPDNCVPPVAPRTPIPSSAHQHMTFAWADADKPKRWPECLCVDLFPPSPTPVRDTCTLHVSRQAL